MNICPKCGLPLEACVCKEIGKSEQKIYIKTEKKKFGKKVTIISGFQDMDLKSIAKSLKQELACGGTVKDKTIELQGDHTKVAKDVLAKLGFSKDMIEVK